MLDGREACIHEGRYAETLTHRSRMLQLLLHEVRS